MRWLLLRGLVREQRHWGPFRDLFASAAGPVVTLDLPGVGTEHTRPSPMTLEGIVEDVRRRFVSVREGEVQNEPWGLLAISLGGMVALSWCAAHPEDFQRAVVINTSAGDLSLPTERFNWRRYRTLFRAMRSSSTLDRERLVIDLTVARPGDRDGLAQEWAGYAEAAPVARRTLAAQLLAAARSRAPGRLATPLLVLSSFGDELVQPMCSFRIAQRYNAELAVHPWAGHDLPRDAPQWVVESTLRRPPTR